jgi:putative hydrolases of HD superfamily
MLHNMDTKGGSWVDHGVTADQVAPKVDLIGEGSEPLGAYARRMVTTAVERGILLPGSSQTK